MFGEQLGQIGPLWLFECLGLGGLLTEYTTETAKFLIWYKQPCVKLTKTQITLKKIMRSIDDGQSMRSIVAISISSFLNRGFDPLD